MIADRILGPVARAAAALPGAARFEGARAVARRELVGNLKSIRMIVVTALLMLAVVGSAAGFSALSASSGAGGTAPVGFVHTTWPDGPNGSAALVVWVSDPFGTPRRGVDVTVTEGSSTLNVLGSKSTDSAGLVRFENLTTGSYSVIVGGGSIFDLPRTVYVPLFAENFTVDMVARDIGGNGSAGDILIHALNRDGSPLAGPQVKEGSAVVATLDAQGFAHLVRGPGNYSFTIEHDGRVSGLQTHVGEASPTILSGGPNPVMHVVMGAFVPLILPIMAIAVAHDAIARERAQGSLESLLSRPATRRGVLLGKFVGSTGALLVPVYASVTVGALVIGGITGKSIDGGFFGGILVGLTAYTAAYVLLLLVLSTLARTTGTAIMFGVLLWLLYNLMWGVVVLLLQGAVGLTPSDRGYWELALYADLFNLNNLYTGIVQVSYPSGANPFTFSGQELLPAWTPFAAYAVWLVALFLLALWVFDRKAAE